MTNKIHRVEIRSKPDRSDRVSCDVFWMADYHPGHPDGENRTAERGQSFRVSLVDIRRRWPNAKIEPFAG